MVAIGFIKLAILILELHVVTFYFLISCHDIARHRASMSCILSVACYSIVLYSTFSPVQFRLY